MKSIIIQNNHNNNKIEYFAFICYDFPIINNEILEIKRFDTFRLDIEQLLQISILYYQYFLFHHYEKTYILNLENNNKIIICEINSKNISQFIWSEVSYTMTSINDEMSLDITTEEEELENKKENKRKKAKDNYNRFNIKNNDEFNPIKSIDAPNIFDRKVLHPIHKSKTYIHKTMKYQVNNNIFNNTENKYEEKPKINDVLKNQKKTIDTRKNQNNIQKINIKDNKNIKSNETINIFSIVEKKKDENNTNDNNTFLNHNRNNVNINNSVDKNGNEKNELNIINNVKEKNKKIISKKEKNNDTDNKNIFPNIKKIDIKDNKNIKSDENTFVEKKKRK